MTKFRELQEREYSEDDIKKINLRPEDTGRGLEDKFKNIVSYSYYDGDQIIAIVGVAKINDNTCELWLVLDECSRRYVREVYFYAFKLLDDIEKYFERIQAIVRADWPAAIHFLERLGFKKEGLMEKFGIKGEDFYLYGRIR